jgi:hypothetical protein
MVSSEDNNPSTSAPLLECFYRNKYERWYWNLIDSCPTSKPEGLKCEEHHVVPKCLGGHKTDPQNLCYPTIRQHFVLHRLLNKMYPTHEGLWYAIFRMSIKGDSRIYSYLRENYVRSKAHNEKIKKALTGKPLSDERREKISRARLESLKVLKGSDHPQANKDLWIRADEIKKVWIENGKPRWIKLGSLIGLKSRCKTLQTMIKAFKEEDIV